MKCVLYSAELEYPGSDVDFAEPTRADWDRLLVAVRCSGEVEMRINTHTRLTVPARTGSRRSVIVEYTPEVPVLLSNHAASSSIFGQLQARSFSRQKTESIWRIGLTIEPGKSLMHTFDPNDSPILRTGKKFVVRFLEAPAQKSILTPV